MNKSGSISLQQKQQLSASLYSSFYEPLPQALLEVVNDLFEEQTDLEKIVRKIMQRALTLLQCERCSVLLLEDINSPVRLFSDPVNALVILCCYTYAMSFP